MLISERLQQLLDYLLPNEVLADVGCDHAFLPIEYAKLYPNTKVYALDNKKAPLKQAKKNIAVNNLSKWVIPLLSEGLENLPLDVKQLCIAGLGGSNILEILNKHYTKTEGIENFVFEPNNNAPSLRYYLSNQGFVIKAETMVKENDVIYEIMQVVHGEQKLTDTEITFGPHLVKEKSPLFYERWQNYANYLESMLKRIPDAYTNRRQEIIYQLEEIKKQIS